MVHPKLRVIFFLCALNVSAFLLAWAFLDRSAWLWIVALALSINTLWWTYDHVLVFWKLKGERLEGQDAWGLLKSVHGLAEELYMPRPAVFFVDAGYAQIFGYARSEKSARIFITRGALELLNFSERQAALTYQMCALKASQGLIHYWLGALLDLSWRVSVGVERTLAFIFGWSPPVARWLVAPWSWLLQHLLLRAREIERLDREVAARLREPADLARALWKLHAYTRTRPWPEAWVFQPMCLVDPIPQTHGLRPRGQLAIERRIEALAGYFPL